MQSIFEYRNYRSYLLDLFQHEKVQSKSTTLARYSSGFGLAASTFKMILDGSRNLTIHNIHVIAQALRLTSEETAYFEAMVLRDQAVHSHERSYYSRRLQAAIPDIRTTTVRVSKRQVIDEWYIPAILIYLIDCAPKGREGIDKAIRNISDRLRIPVKRVQQYVTMFQDLGILSIEGKTVHVLFDKVGRELAQARYLKLVIQEAVARMDKYYGKDDHLFSADCLTLSDDDYQHFKRDYHDLLDRYISQSNNNENRRQVYFVSTQIFPAI